MREYSKQSIFFQREKKSIVLNNSTPYKLGYFPIFLYCLYMYVCSHVGKVCTCVESTGYLQLLLPRCHPSWFQTGSLSVLNFVDQARLAGPRAPGMHLVLTQPWDSKNLRPGQRFIWMELASSCLHGKHLTKQTTFLAFIKFINSMG